MDRLWTGYGQAMDRLWTGYGQAMDRLWTGYGQAHFKTYFKAYFKVLTFPWQVALRACKGKVS